MKLGNSDWNSNFIILIMNNQIYKCFMYCVCVFFLIFQYEKIKKKAYPWLWFVQLGTSHASNDEMVLIKKYIYNVFQKIRR